MVVQPSQNQVAPSAAPVGSNNTVNGRVGEYRSDASGQAQATAPSQRLLDIAVGEVRSDGQPQARARRDQQDGEIGAKPQRFFSDRDQSLIDELVSLGHFVPRGSFVNVVI